MAKLRQGDIVNCAIKDDVIVSCYETYDDIRSFAIISVQEYGYYLFIPHFVNIKNSERADSSKVRKFDFDPKFLDEQVIYVTTSCIMSIVSRDVGLQCALCKQACAFAEPNQEDGTTFVCYSCRTNPYL